MTDLISLNSVTIGYDNKIVLRDVDLTVKRGEIITIVGPNGSGKTSMMRALIGALVPTTGSVSRSKSLRVGYVPQKLNVDHSFPITVRRFLSVPKHATAEQISEAADCRLRRYCSAISWLLVGAILFSFGLGLRLY